MSGARSDQWGRAAEDQAAAWYETRGGEVIARRARNAAGELDLVIAQDDQIVFVEVKARRSFQAALEAVSPRSRIRLTQAAEGFLSEHGLSDRNCRFDIAAIDRHGGFKIVENAICA